jgi:hypothetical protein
MCCPGEIREIPTGMDTNPRATAMATRITARAASLEFMMDTSALWVDEEP